MGLPSRLCDEFRGSGGWREETMDIHESFDNWPTTCQMSTLITQPSFVRLLRTNSRLLPVVLVIAVRWSGVGGLPMGVTIA